MTKVNLIFLISLATIIISCNQQDKLKTAYKDTQTNETSISAERLKTNTSGLSNLQAIIKTVHGNIVIKFYTKKAPNTVTRIIQLIQKGFYDGLKFHRVYPNYIIQTGDPTATGNGGSGLKLKAEFNDIQHIKGTVAMARESNNPDSADSQFYITLTTRPHLDKKYTVFGQVVNGLNILDKIQQDDKILSIVLKK